MALSLRRWLTPPSFAREDETRRARLLHTFVLGVIVATAVCFPVAALVDRNQASRYLFELLAFQLIAAVVLVLLHSGRLALSCAIAVIVPWMVVMIAAITAGGMERVTYLPGATIVVLAGVLLGPREAVLTAGGTLLGAAGIAVAAQKGLLLDPGQSASAWGSLAGGAASYGILIVLMALTSRRVQQALGQAQKELAERRDAVEALRTSEEALRASEGKQKEALSLIRAALESTADGILVVDTNGKVLAMNGKFVSLWGIPRDLADSRDDARLLSSVLDQLIDPARFLQKVQQLYHEPEAVSFDVLEFKDGRMFERYSQPQRIDGQIVGRVWSFRDVTDRRHSEEARRRLEEQLYQAQKMEALGTLARGIAHDFNNILAAMVSHAEVAKLELLDRPVTQQALDEVLRAGQRAKELTHQILVFSRAGSHELRPTRLGPIITECVQLLRSSLPKSIEVRATLLPDEPEVLADSSRMHQVIMNLSVNARQAIGDMPGKIAVTLERSVVGPASLLLAQGVFPGDYLRLEVVDTGKGIDPGTLPRIFEPFFSTKSPSQGSGLGLAVVHSILLSHRGAIEVRSQLGGGSRFAVYLPVNSARSDPVESTSPGSLKTGRGQRIVLVDDEVSVLEGNRRLLERIGYRVQSFTDPHAAVKEVQDNPSAVDLLITDLTMPRLSGIEVARSVRAVRADLPIILATGFDEGWTIEKIQQMGIGELLAKPFTLAELAAAVARQLPSEKAEGPLR